MSKNTSIILSDYFEKFVADKVASGRFGNASEVVRAGLRLLEREERALEELRAAIDEGMSSGDPPEGEEIFTRLGANDGLQKPGA